MCGDHPEELKHRRCFIWSGCSSSRSFMSQVFLFPIPPPHPSLYFLSFQASPARIMPESMMSHLMNLFPLLIVQSLKPGSSKPDNQKGQYLKSHLRGSAPRAMQSSQYSSSETCNMLHLKYLFCFPFFLVPQSVQTLMR